MPAITLDLLRRRAEHNEGLVGSLEELSLHQEELEAINEVLGRSCRQLKILYLQNNIIGKIENLVHMKRLEYLNLALNNITKIEGLQSCESLRKLDLTVNFIDVHTLAESITHLQPLQDLQELYFMGNPAQVHWSGFNHYVIARLPQLRILDGTEITRSARIIAEQRLPQLEAQLESLREEKLREIALGPTPSPFAESKTGADDADEMTDHTPETRTRIYREMAEQKREKEERERENMPKERDHEREHKEAIERAREREEQGKILQCNEGKWDFRFDEQSKPGNIVLDIGTPKHLDSSLIDVDVHPTYISVVIKSKVLRLSLPEEVQADNASAQRSKTTGRLAITMPKANHKLTLQSRRK